MDPELARLVEADTPDFNPLLAEGYAVQQVNQPIYEPELRKWLTGSAMYIHQLFKAAAASFPASLQYVGCQLCTPEEEFKYRTREDWRDKKRKFDFSRTDVRLCKFHFRYNNEQFYHYLFIPFVGIAGLFHLNGSRYFVAPVLKDPLITRTKDHIFVRLMKTRFTVRREVVSYLEDFTRVQHTQLHHTNLFRGEQKNKRSLEGEKPQEKGFVSLVHYLFCKYGVQIAFETFAKAKPVIGAAEVNAKAYPEADWVICSSTGVPPKGMSVRNYIPSNLRIAIRREEYTSLVRRFVGAFFYVVDHYPYRLTAEHVESKLLWRILLGLFIFPSSRGEGDIQNTVNRHLEWLDEYVDFITQAKIRQLGWPVNNTFELFAYVVEHYDQWWVTDKAPGPSMYDKELEVLQFLLNDIMQGIHNLGFALRRPQKKPLKSDKLRQMFSSFLPATAIFKVRKNHSELMTSSVSGDNMAAKITSKIVPQERYIRPNPKSEEQAMKMRKPHELLHASVAEVGSYARLSRNSPDGRDHINLMVALDAQGAIQRNPACAEIFDDIQKEIEAARNK